MASQRTRGRGLFSEGETQEPQSKRGAPASPKDTQGGEDHLRITVYATMDQLDHLDRERIQIRRATRTVLERTGIIRGLIEGWMRSGVDFAALGAATEEEVAGIVAERLSRGAP